MALSEAVVQQLWEKARAVSGIDPTVWRKDECGAWIRREHYGHADSDFGWTARNVSAGGPATLDNLRPFHRRNDYDVANGRAHCRATAEAEGIANRAL